MPLQIYTAEPVKLEANQTLVFFRRKKVAADKAFRAVVVPSYSLPVASTVEILGGNEVRTNAADVFQTAIVEAFHSAAGSILKRFCEEQPEAKEVSEDLFSFSNVVIEMQASESGQRLNGDQIAEWYKDSETAKLATIRYKDKPEASKKEAALKAAYLSLASNNSGIQPNLAIKMMAYLAPEDTDNAVCKAIAKRLEKLSKADTSDDL